MGFLASGIFLVVIALLLGLASFALFKTRYRELSGLEALHIVVSVLCGVATVAGVIMVSMGLFEIFN